MDIFNPLSWYIFYTSFFTLLSLSGIIKLYSFSVWVTLSLFHFPCLLLYFPFPLSWLRFLVSLPSQCLFFSPPTPLLSFLSLYMFFHQHRLHPLLYLLLVFVSFLFLVFSFFFVFVYLYYLCLCMFLSLVCLSVFLYRAIPRNKSKHTWWRVQNITMSRVIK